jgi:hypothetical protein
MSDTGYGPPGVDLSAFTKRASAVPPPPLIKPATTTPPPPAREPSPDGRRPASSGRRRKEPAVEGAQPRDGKVQFFVHLPPDQHGWLRERATAAGWPKREVILEAFVAHRDALRAHDPDAQRRSEAGLPPRAPGRRKDVGGMPSNVYMGRAEAAVLDHHARELGMSRSQMVSELLRLAAAGPPQAGPGPTARQRGAATPPKSARTTAPRPKG